MLDAQSGSDTESSSDDGCLLEDTKESFISTLIHTGFCEHWLILLVVCFLYRYSIANTRNAMAVPTNEQIFHFTNPQSSYIRPMQLLVSSDLGPPQQ